MPPASEEQRKKPAGVFFLGSEGSLVSTRGERPSLTVAEGRPFARKHYCESRNFDALMQCWKGVEHCTVIGAVELKAHKLTVSGIANMCCPTDILDK